MVIYVINKTTNKTGLKSNKVFYQTIILTHWNQVAIRLQIFADHEEYHERYSVTIILNWCLVKKPPIIMVTLDTCKVIFLCSYRVVNANFN